MSSVILMYGKKKWKLYEKTVRWKEFKEPTNQQARVFHSFLEILLAGCRPYGYCFVCFSVLFCWVGRQELEIVHGNLHISFCTTKLGSLVDVQESNDPDGLKTFYFHWILHDILWNLLKNHIKIKFGGIYCLATSPPPPTHFLWNRK